MCIYVRSCKNGVRFFSQTAIGKVPICEFGCTGTTRCGPIPIPSEHLHVNGLFRHFFRSVELPVLWTMKLNWICHWNQITFYYTWLQWTQRGVKVEIFWVILPTVNKRHKLTGFSPVILLKCRPIAGFINFCVKHSGHQDLSQLHYFVKHELLHILVTAKFLKTLLGLFTFALCILSRPRRLTFDSTSAGVRNSRTWLV